jgi:hypothetical protein
MYNPSSVANDIVFASNSNNMVFFNLRGVVGTGKITLGDLGAITWASTTTAYNLSSDTSISRSSAGVVSVDTNVVGNGLGSLSLATVIVSNAYEFSSGASLFIWSPGVNELVFDGNNNPGVYFDLRQVSAGAAVIALASLGVVGWGSATTAFNNTRDTGISRLAAGSLAIGTGAAGSIAGNLSYNRINTAGADHAGQVTVTAGNTTQAKAFAANYTGTGQPVIILTPTSDPLALGVPVGYWVTYSGSTGAWTGWVLNIQTALAGNVTFNYCVIGQA